MAAEKFCCNPLCPQHVTTLYGHRIVVRSEKGRHEYERHLFKRDNGEKFYLCDVCKSAIDLVTGSI